MKKCIVIFYLIILNILAACREEQPSQVVSLTPPEGLSYAAIFDVTQNVFLDKRVRKLLTESFQSLLEISENLRDDWGGLKFLPEFPETHFLALLTLVYQHDTRLFQKMKTVLQDVVSHPDDSKKYEEAQRQLSEIAKLVNVKDTFRQLMDPLSVLEFLGEKNLSQVKFLVNHKRVYKDGKERAEDNLVQAWIDFIDASQQELMINVFDFDLERVAQALYSAAKRGVKIKVGIDKNVLNSRKEVQDIYQRYFLTPKSGSGFLQFIPVETSYLNHQKLAVRDWSLAHNAAVLVSSGNLTKSCLSPYGDLDGVISQKSEWSLPNANHLLVIQNSIFSQVVRYELYKVLDARLKTQEYPLHGIYRIPLNKEGSYFDISFSPRGGFSDPNRDIIAKVVKESRDAIRMLQFAFSSRTIEDALFERIKKSILTKEKFLFASVGDSSFSVRDWSAFLRMSGYKIVDKKYVFDQQSRWVLLFPSLSDFYAWADNIRVAPKNYGVHYVNKLTGKRTYKDDSQAMQTTSKIHHKVLISGENFDIYSKSILGSSYNFSENAKNNYEQIIIFHDKDIHNESIAMFYGLFNFTYDNEKVLSLKNILRDKYLVDETENIYELSKDLLQ